LNVGAQTSGTWTIGQAQLEKGSTATSFDYRPYGTEFMLCQRYYQVIGGNAADSFAVFFLATARGTASVEARGGVVLPVRMRSTPSNAFTGTMRITDGHTNATSVSSISIANSASPSAVGILANGGSALSWAGTNQAVLVTAQSDANAAILFASEL
jgi:hypothetical protein